MSRTRFSFKTQPAGRQLQPRTAPGAGSDSTRLDYRRFRGAGGSEGAAPDVTSNSQSEGGVRRDVRQPIRKPRRRADRRPIRRRRHAFKLWAPREPAVRGERPVSGRPRAGDSADGRGIGAVAGRAGGGLSSAPPRALESGARRRGSPRKEGGAPALGGDPAAGPGTFLPGGRCKERHSLSRPRGDLRRARPRGCWGSPVTDRRCAFPSEGETFRGNCTRTDGQPHRRPRPCERQQRFPLQWNSSVLARFCGFR